MANAGIGDRLIARLGEGQATTDELIAAVGPAASPKTVYSRLMALKYEGRVIFTGDGPCRTWGLPGVALVPAEASSSKTRAFPSAWKPSHDGLPALEGAARKGDVLLIDHPEPWRDSQLVALTRDPDPYGVAQAWDKRQQQYCYVRAVAPCQSRTSRVEGEKALERLVCS